MTLIAKACWKQATCAGQLILLFLSGCHASAPGFAPKHAGGPGFTHGTPAANSGERHVLATLAASDSHAYEISIQSRTAEQAARDAERFGSDGGSAPFVIPLIDRATRQSTDEVMLFQSSCGAASVHSVPYILGGDRGSQSWTTDDEHCDVGISARLVSLSASESALLLTQAAGYEYRYSRHDVYVVQAGHLRKLWSFHEDETAVDRSSTTAISGRRPDVQDIAFIHVRRDVDGVAQHVASQRLRFDPTRSELVATSLPDAMAPIFTLVVGAIQDPAAAWTLDQECRSELVLLTSKLLPGETTPDYFFGALFARQEDAALALGQVRSCAGAVRAELVVQKSM